MKRAVKSKTMWSFSLIGIASVFASIEWDQIKAIVPPAMWPKLMAIVSVVGIVLRLLTSDAIRFGGEER